MPTLTFLLLQLVATASIAFANDNRAANLWGFNYAFDDKVFSALELHPASGEPKTNEITGKITLASEISCETMIHRYVIAYIPWGIVELSVKQSLKELQETKKEDLQATGLPTSCPIPAGDYALQWVPAPAALVPDLGSSGTFTVGFNAVDSAQTLFNGTFTVQLQRIKS